MKKLTATLIALLVAGLVLWVFFNHRKSSDSLGEATAAEKQRPAPETKVSAEPAAITKQDEDEDTALESADEAERLRYRQERIERANREYNTPIVLYGSVLDLNGKPVAGATVEYVSVEGSFVGTRQIQSAPDGRFTISGIRGKYLDVQVTHPDYYEQRDSRRSFTYAGNDRGPDFKPDPARPEIFRLRKKGEAAELVQLQTHVRFDGNEPERSFSFFNHSRRRDRPEHVTLRRVETAERDASGQPIRRLEMVVLGGGIQQRLDPFAFTAPSDGYQSSMYFMRPVHGKLDYFVRFSSGNYGRFTIMGGAGDYLIESYLNPDNSPNLEYDEAKRITVVPTGKKGIDLLYPAKDEPPKKP
ncbi:MAG: carboxypeptidase-like regulatory domain-containing protein [Candidatus Didemnitutus sp.]|nr:carboxypeptidase-like regulatory domain-containing protein [Candidatus Didemnitutus sp.]